MNTILKQLFEARQRSSNILHRKLLSNAQDEIAGRLHILNADPTTRNMQDLVGAWTRAIHTLDRCKPPHNGGDGGAQSRGVA